jgi:hypothetical protein
MRGHVNRRRAKAYVLRVLAAEARHHIGNGSEWIERPSKVDADGAFSPADQRRIVGAIEEVAGELARRSERLSARDATFRRKAR